MCCHCGGCLWRPCWRPKNSVIAWGSWRVGWHVLERAFKMGASGMQWLPRRPWLGLRRGSQAANEAAALEAHHGIDHGFCKTRKASVGKQAASSDTRWGPSDDVFQPWMLNEQLASPRGCCGAGPEHVLGRVVCAAAVWAQAGLRVASSMQPALVPQAPSEEQGGAGGGSMVSAVRTVEPGLQACKLSWPAAGCLSACCGSDGIAEMVSSCRGVVPQVNGCA